MKNISVEEKMVHFAPSHRYPLVCSVRSEGRVIQDGAESRWQQRCLRKMVTAFFYPCPCSQASMSTVFTISLYLLLLNFIVSVST